VATITANDTPLGGNEEEAAPVITTHDSENHGLPRFFFAAAAALILSATQGVIQRLPGISDWLRDADYGGHMVTNLAHTHITIVGAGTISLTGLLYFVLPKVTRRPLFSTSLTNLSFWGTIIGVFGFYIAMLSIGLYEGAMVHAGWPYQAARDWMGAWHKAPMAITGAIMGIGYWTFVTNVYVTVSRASAARRNGEANAPSDAEFLLAKFFLMGATGLLIGTVQGVYQVLPWMLDWLHKTGEAGHMIDPMAHAHMNLVGGVSVAIMGLLYYFVPRITGRPVFSHRLATLSFGCIVIGVFGFYLSAVTLGAIEGNMVLEGFTDVEAKEAMGFWHPFLMATTASIMGVGFWSFIANLFLTVRRGPTSDAPPDRNLARFLVFAAAALLLGTIQGVIQILDVSEEWLEDALPSSYFVTPLSHAQLNMVGFAILSLATMSVFLLPRLLGRPVEYPQRGIQALTVIAMGVTATYVVFLSVGLAESMAIHSGATAAEAREVVGGYWGRYVLFISAQALLGVGYLLYFRHIARTIGGELIRAYFRDFRGRIANAGSQSVRVHPRALPESPNMAQRKALITFAFEAIGGALGFMGMGWIFSGRPFIGIMLLGSWGGGFWTFVYVVLAVAGGASLLPFLLIPYFALPVLSGLLAYRTYLAHARAHLA
jgi:heme/copper-type cytochrome/quinol oxidase subunit 1